MRFHKGFNSLFCWTKKFLTQSHTPLCGLTLRGLHTGRLHPKVQSLKPEKGIPFKWHIPMVASGMGGGAVTTSNLLISSSLLVFHADEVNLQIILYLFLFN